MTFFYNLNKKLDGIAAKPESAQLNERDMSRAAKGYEKYGKEGMQALAKAGREGKDLDKVRDKYNRYDDKSVEEGILDNIKMATKKLTGGVNKAIGHGTDADMMMDLQKKMGMPPQSQHGKPGMAEPKEGNEFSGELQQARASGEKEFSVDGKTYPVKETEMTPKQKSFAALAEPRDKITFADKIAGAKKEVDEMLGDVAAEAMKNALSGGQKKLDKNNNGKLDANDFAMLRKGSKKQVADEGFPTVDSARDEMRKRKVGDVTHGAKHDTQEIPGGRRVTRRLDPNTGYSVGADDDKPADGEKRSRGRPKGAPKAPERVTANATKHKGGRKVKEDDTEIINRGEYDREGDMAKDTIKTVVRHAQALEKILGNNDNLPEWVQSKLAKIESMMTAVDDYMQNQQDDDMDSEQKPIAEKASSKKQQRFMGMAHAMQKGEQVKGASPELKKVANTMKKGDAEDFASTKHKGLPEKVSKKKEKTEESDAPSKGSGGMTFGKGIYDSINRDLEDMISESMNVNVSMNVDEHGEPRKSITVSAEGEAAEQLAQLLNLAGMSQSSSGYQAACPTCGSSNCGCEELDENQPDWPTNTEIGGENDPLMHMYAGGLNRPKSTGQTTGAPYNSQSQRRGAMAEDTDLGMQLYAELKSFKG